MVRVENINKSFNGLPVLHDVSITVSEGEVFSLAGESGCGKSTLLRIIAGLEHPDHGKVVLDERDITNVKPEHRQFGFVFQNLSLFPHLTVKQNILYGLKSNRKSEQKLMEMLDITGMTGLGARYPHQLSGGQQQRVALARALAIDPKLLILDEPFSSLDELIKARLRDEMFGLLRDLGITTILVSHQAQDSFLIADQQAVMQDGRIVQTGTPSAIYQNPKSPYIASLFGPCVLLSGTKKDDKAVTHFGSITLPDLPEKFTLLIRPENIAISDSNDFSFCGLIKHIAFKGPHEVLTIASENAHTTISFETERSGLKVGQKVFLKVSGGMVVVLP